MTVHTFHIFDRRGKTLFTKRYVKSGKSSANSMDVGGNGNIAEDDDDDDDENNEQLSEQRKLVFGMIYSLRELSGSLCPSGTGDLQLVKTGASTLYNYETVSGLRFVLYTTADTSTGGGGSSSSATGGGSGTSSTSPTPPGSTITGTLTTPNMATTPSNLIGGSAPGSGTNTPMHAGSAHGGIRMMMTNPAVTNHIRAALQHIYEHLWVNFVVRSPMYEGSHNPNVRSTNFEASLDNYLKGMPWFR